MRRVLQCSGESEVQSHYCYRMNSSTVWATWGTILSRVFFRDGAPESLLTLYLCIHRQHKVDSVGLNKEHVKLGGICGDAGGKELEQREWGGFDQSTLYACVKFSNNENIKRDGPAVRLFFQRS